MSLGDIGLLLGVFAPVSALAGALTAGLLVNQIGFAPALVRRSSPVGGDISYWPVRMVLSPSPRRCPVLVDHFVSGMTAVALFSLMMDWVAGDRWH